MLNQSASILIGNNKSVRKPFIVSANAQQLHGYLLIDWPTREREREREKEDISFLKKHSTFYLTTATSTTQSQVETWKIAVLYTCFPPSVNRSSEHWTIEQLQFALPPLAHEMRPPRLKMQSNSKWNSEKLWPVGVCVGEKSRHH